MSLARHALQAVANGLLLAMVAPPIAAVTFLLLTIASDASARQGFDSSVGSIVLLVLGAATGSYLVGAIPAFLAGLALPSVSKVLPAVLASAATGCLGVLAYALTFGSHLLASPNLLSSLSSYALPAFIGVAAAAFIAQRIERRHAEA